MKVFLRYRFQMMVRYSHRASTKTNDLALQCTLLTLQVIQAPVGSVERAGLIKQLEDNSVKILKLRQELE